MALRAFAWSGWTNLFALQIDLFPTQPCHVRRPEPRRQSEARHVAQVLPTLAAASVDAAITDRPYLRRYKDRWGQALANDDKPEVVVGVYAELYRVLKPHSFCVTFYGYPRLDAFVHAWIKAGFDTVGHIVWTKPYASSSRFVRNA